MPVADMIMEGLELMVVGMGIVFTFLIVLVLAMSAMSRLARIIEPPVTAPPSRAATIPTHGAQVKEDENLIAVISAAVQVFRSRQS